MRKKTYYLNLNKFARFIFNLFAGLATLGLVCYLWIEILLGLAGMGLAGM